MHETLETIRCNQCRVQFGITIILEFGTTTVAIMEQLTRKSIDAGWLFIPAGPFTVGDRVSKSQHFCPACKLKVNQPT